MSSPFPVSVTASISLPRFLTQTRNLFPFTGHLNALIFMFFERHSSPLCLDACPRWLKQSIDTYSKFDSGRRMRPIHAHFQRIKVAIILYFHLLERLLISNDNSHSMMACLQLACVLSRRRCHVAHWHSLDRFSLFRQRRLLCHSLSVAQSSCIVGQIQLSLPKGILVILFNFFVNNFF